MGPQSPESEPVTAYELQQPSKLLEAQRVVGIAESLVVSDAHVTPPGRTLLHAAQAAPRSVLTRYNCTYSNQLHHAPSSCFHSSRGHVPDGMCQ